MTLSPAGVVFVAVLSSVATALLVGLVARRFFDRRITAAGDALAERVREAMEEGAEKVIPKVRDAVRAGFDRSIAESIPVVRDEVAAGVREGAENVLPRVKEEVRDGVEQAIASAITGGVVGKAGEELARKSSSILQKILGGEDVR